MKIIVSLLLLTSIIVLAGDSTPQSSVAVGRYHLLSARQSIASGSLQSMDCIYRIDTLTGQVWRLNSRVITAPEGKPVIEEVWMPTLELTLTNPPKAMSTTTQDQ